MSGTQDYFLNMNFREISGHLVMVICLNLTRCPAPLLDHILHIDYH